MIYYALLLFFCLEYVRPGNFIHGLDVLRLNSLVPLIAVVGTAFRKRSATRGRERADPNDWIFALLLGLMGISLLIVADITLYAWRVLTTVVGYVLVYWVLTKQITDMSRMKGLFKTLVFIHLAMAALTPEMFTDPGERHYLSSGTFLGDGNDFALSINVVLPFCLFLMYDAPRVFQKVLWAAALVVLVLCIVATQSRGGTLALAAVGVYYWFKSDRKVLTAAVAMIALAAVILFAPTRYFERMDTISHYEEDGSAQGRLSAWRAGVRMALSNPIFGVGAGQFPANYPRFAPTGSDGPEVAWKTAHSIYFLLLGELGLPGISLLLSFIIINLARNRRSLRSLRSPAPGEARHARLLACLSASLIAYAVGGAFLSAAYYPHMYVLGGLMVAGRRMTAHGIETSSGSARPAESAPAVTHHWALRRVTNTHAS